MFQSLSEQEIALNEQVKSQEKKLRTVAPDPTQVKKLTEKVEKLRKGTFLITIYVPVFNITILTINFGMVFVPMHRL